MYICVPVLLLMVVTSVRGQDPTTVCYPPLLQTTYLNVVSNDRGLISIDFARQKFVEASSVTNTTVIHDFANLKSYAITGSGNYTTCKAFKLPQNQVMYRCLPPFAKLVSEATGYFHYITANRMYVQTWDVDREDGGVNRVFFSVVGGQPFWPVMSQEYGYHGTTNMYMYLNPTPSVANLSVFTVPTECFTAPVKTPPIVG